MSKEKIGTTPEHAYNPQAMAEFGAERTKEIQEQKQLEKAETTAENNAEKLTQEALEKASSIEREKQPETRAQEASPVERRKATSSKTERDAAFTVTMNEVESQISASSRAFSKIIHNKVVEKVSDGVGNSVARPNAIFTGAVFAFILTLGIYLLAKNLGYPLSGFETIGAFILGWALGIVYDFLKVMVTGRR